MALRHVSLSSARGDRESRLVTTIRVVAARGSVRGAGAVQVERPAGLNPGPPPAAKGHDERTRPTRAPL